MSTFSAPGLPTAVPRLHAIVDVQGADDPIPLTVGVLDAGAPLLQVRAKGVSDRERLELTTQIARVCHERQALCIATDRVDVGLASGAGSVPIGATDRPVPAARALLDLDGDGDDRLLGATARDGDGARAAVKADADCLGDGPCYRTSSKTGLPPPGGPARVAAVAAAVDIPVIAADPVPELIEAGARGVEVIGLTRSVRRDPRTARSLARRGRKCRMTRRMAVVGGGVIGLTVAWLTAQIGARVVLLEPTPGTGDSHAADGMLAPVTEAYLGEEHVLALNLRSVAQWPNSAGELAAASSREIDLHTVGTVVAALDSDDRRNLDDLADRLACLGLDVKWLRSRALREREPAQSPNVCGGLAVAGDHAVDNRQVVAALQAAARRVGVDHRAVAAVRVETDADRVTGVTSDDGRVLPADVVVIAAGCWSAQLALPENVSPRVRPVKGQILPLQDGQTQPLLRHVVRGHARARPIYLVPRSHGEIVVGATVQDQGFDTSVTVGETMDLLRAATGSTRATPTGPGARSPRRLRPCSPTAAIPAIPIRNAHAWVRAAIKVAIDWRLGAGHGPLDHGVLTTVPPIDPTGSTA